MNRAHTSWVTQWAAGAALTAGVLWPSTANAQGLPKCRADLDACVVTATTCQQDLQTCDADLTSVQGEADGCNASLSLCSTDLAGCGSSLSGCNSGLTSCNSNLTDCNSNLATCNSTLTSTRSALTSCNSSLGTCTSQRNACQSDLSKCQKDLASTCPLDGMLRMLVNFKTERLGLGDSLTIADCNLFGGSFPELEILQRFDTPAGVENSHFLQVNESTGDGLGDSGSALYLFRSSPFTSQQIQYSYGLQGIKADFATLQTCAALASSLGLCG